MKREEAAWEIAVRRSLAACTETERAWLDERYAGSVTGTAWWRLLDEGYTGNNYVNYHVFFRAPGEAVPRAGLSAQYFPELSIAPQVRLPPALRRVADLALSCVGVYGLRMGCLLIHSLSSVASLDVPAGAEDAFAGALRRFVYRFGQRQPVHLALVRSLDGGLAGRLAPRLAAMRWTCLPGFPCNWIRFPGVTSFDAFLERFASHRRQRLRASLRKVDGADELESVRIRTAAELEPCLDAILALKAETAERHREALAIPIHERREFFPRALELFGNDAFFRLIRRRADGRVLGYFLAVASGATSRGISLGTRYPEGKEYDLWFNLALRMIHDLIGHGVREINLGLGDDEIKGKVGAVPEEQRSALAFFPRVLRVVGEQVIVPRLKRV